jgi:SAM-dependent methyltransferase
MSLPAQADCRWPCSSTNIFRPRDADLSRRTLRLAAAKLQPYGNQAVLLWCPAERLPFADNTFDVVCSLEALEFMTNPQAALREMARVLRPGGLLFASNRINTKLMPGRTWDREQLAQLLVDLNIADADLEPWQKDYDRVWAINGGESEPTGARPLGEFLRCPCCPGLMIEREGAGLRLRRRTRSAATG